MKHDNFNRLFQASEFLHSAFNFLIHQNDIRFRPLLSLRSKRQKILVSTYLLSV